MNNDCLQSVPTVRTLYSLYVLTWQHEYSKKENVGRTSRNLSRGPKSESITMTSEDQKWRMCCLIFVCINIVTSSTPANHKDSSEDSTLPMETRSEPVDLDLNQMKSNNIDQSKSNEKTDKPIVPTMAEERGFHSIKSSIKDSYLDALEHSHTSKDPNEGIVKVDTRPKTSRIIRREFVQGPIYKPEGSSKDPDRVSYESSNDLSYGPPTGSYLPPQDSAASYSPKDPSISYGVPGPVGPSQPPFLPTPSDSYSLPVQSSVNFNNQNYGLPQTSYGAPNPGYGPPVPQNSYGAPSNYLPQQPQQGEPRGYPAPVYGAPYALPNIPQLPSFPSIDFSWPLALKLNAFTIAKILLKLVIFKMIVKFIALICLLLFIPKLEIIKKKTENDDEERSGVNSSNSTLDRLNVLTSLVMSSIDKHEKKNTQQEESCEGFGCRIKKALISNDSWKDYLKLFKSYVVEEQRVKKPTKFS
ncbi:uncharacterized protein LOC107274950 isoform X1 [Cephus cinctus]|uniref:Uncharacterized protein LOC107274950 isoform X1 n=1 Tax=Cephus cinctus TaxID=211228 RepID=A0AAJ7R7I2_CEPCN|nr:uncharacterized protein LOC107274950 isoform X1 [Cephus cinctus]